MSAILAANVTVSNLKVKKLEDGRKIVQATVAFGNGTLTYPTGGVPLTIGNFACPRQVDSFQVDDNGGSVYGASFVKSTGCLKLFALGSHAHNLLLKNAAVADGATTRVNAGTNLIGANTGSDITVAQGGANGGVVASAAGTDPSEQEVASSVAPAAQTYQVTVIGF